MFQLIKNFFICLGSIFRKPRTVVYPREKIIIPEKSRGILQLKLDLDSPGIICNGCGHCMDVCPEDSIRVSRKTLEDGKEVLDSFQLDLGSCIFCGNCVTACELDAITMSYRYQNADFFRKGLLMEKSDLIRPSGTVRDFWK
jgi:NADH-quinone oxidoreductase subunit I